MIKAFHVGPKWQEQIATKLTSQIRERIDPLRTKDGRMAKVQLDFDYEALFSFISKSFEVFIETQGGRQAACLNEIKNAYELLLKLSIEQMVSQNESLRTQVKQFKLDPKTKRPPN